MERVNVAGRVLQPSSLFNDLDSGHSVHLQVDKVPSFRMVNDHSIATNGNRTVLVDNYGNTTYMKSRLSAVNGTAGVKRHRECVTFDDPPSLDLQPVKYTRHYDGGVAGIDLRSHHQLLDQTRNLPCKDIINEDLRPLAGSYHIELSFHRKNGIQDRDCSVSQRVEQSLDVDYSKRRPNQGSDAIVGNGYSFARAPLPGDDPSLARQSLNDRHLSIPTSSRDNIKHRDVGISLGAEFQKTQKCTGGDEPDSAMNGFGRGDQRKPSRIDRLNQRQPDRLIALKQTIENQRLRKANIGSKENSYNSSELEQKLEFFKDDIETSFSLTRHRDMNGTHHQELPKNSCNDQVPDRRVQTTNVQHPTANMNTTFSVEDEVPKPAPSINRVHHQQSDTVVLKSDSRAFSIDDQIHPKVIPRKVASCSGVHVQTGSMKSVVHKATNVRKSSSDSQQILLPDKVSSSAEVTVPAKPQLQLRYSSKEVTSGVQQQQIVPCRQRTGPHLTSDNQQTTKGNQVLPAAPKRAINDISASSWRAGAEVVRKHLGPAKKSLQTIKSPVTPYTTVPSSKSAEITRLNGGSNSEDIELSGHLDDRDNHQIHPLEIESVPRIEHEVVPTSATGTVEKPNSRVVPKDKRQVSSSELRYITERQPRSVTKSKPSISHSIVKPLDGKGVDLNQQKSIERTVAACSDNDIAGGQMDVSNGSIDCTVNGVITPSDPRFSSDIATPEQQLVTSSETFLNSEDKDPVSGAAIDGDRRDSYVGRRSRSYNVAEVKDYMKKKRMQRRDTRDFASKQSTSRCHKRHSAPLDSNLQNFTSRLADKKYTSGANNESSSVPVNSSATRNEVALSDDSHYKHERAHDIESYASAVPKKTDTVISYGDNRSKPLSSGNSKPASHSNDATSHVATLHDPVTSSYLPTFSISSVVYPGASSHSVRIPIVPPSYDSYQPQSSYITKAEKLTKLRFAATTLMSRVDGQRKQLELVKGCGTGSSSADWSLDTAGKLCDSIKASHVQTHDLREITDKENTSKYPTSAESPGSVHSERAGSIDDIYNRHRHSANSAFIMQGSKLRQLRSQRPLVAVNHSYVSSDLDASNDDSMLVEYEQTTDKKASRRRGADDQYPVRRQQDYISSAETSRSSSPVTENRSVVSSSPSHEMRVKLDEKFLTARQQKLNLRRSNVETALAFMKQLDQEEKEIEKMEAQVASLAASSTVDVNESTHLSDTMMSDQSDCENRIQVLHQELQRRKAEIEKLKRERSKKFAKNIQFGKEFEMRNVGSRLQPIAADVNSPSGDASAKHSTSHQTSSPKKQLGHAGLPVFSDYSNENKADQGKSVIASDVSRQKLDSDVICPGQQQLPASDVILHRDISSSAVTSHDRPRSPKSQSSEDHTQSLPLSSSSVRDVRMLSAASSRSSKVPTQSPQNSDRSVKQSSPSYQPVRKPITPSDGDNKLSSKMIEGEKQSFETPMSNDSSDDATWPSADMCFEESAVVSKGDNEKFNKSDGSSSVRQTTTFPKEISKVDMLSDKLGEYNADSLKSSKPGFTMNDMCPKENVTERDNSLSSSTLSNSISVERKDQDPSKSSSNSSQLKMKVLRNTENLTKQSRSPDENKNADNLSNSVSYSEDFSAVSSTSGTPNASKLASKRTNSECISAVPEEKVSSSHLPRPADDVCKTEEDITEDLSAEDSQIDSTSEVQLELNHDTDTKSKTGAINDNLESKIQTLEPALVPSHNNDTCDNELTGRSLTDEKPPLELFHDEFPAVLEAKQESDVVVLNQQSVSSSDSRVADSSDDLDRLISIAAAAVESFASKDDRIVHSTTHTLLTDAIDEMMTIRNKKRADGGNVTNSPTKTVDSVKSSASDSSDGQGDELHSGGWDDWIDDDFGLRPPPPKYSDVVPPGDLVEGRSKIPQPKSAVSSSVGASQVKPVVQRLAVVAQTTEQIVPLVDKIVDEFWECRRYGEVWSCNHPPPAQYYSDAEAVGATNEAACQRAHKKLLLDLVAETLSDVYVNEEEDEHSRDASRQRSSYNRWRRNHDPPTTVDVLKPLVESRVLQQLGLDISPLASRPVLKWGAARKKHDNVDILLIRELRDEEPQWVNYSAEEYTAKMQVVDSLWELLLGETVNILRSNVRRRSVSSEVWLNSSLVESY